MRLLENFKLCIWLRLISIAWMWVISSFSPNYIFLHLLGSKIRSLLFNLDLSWFKAEFHCLWRLAGYDFLTNNPVEKMADAATASKSLQSCLTLFNPIDGSPPGPLSLGFSRQEHWSGLPFPSPMQESEKWKWGLSVTSNSQRPHGL